MFSDFEYYLRALFYRHYVPFGDVNPLMNYLRPLLTQPLTASGVMALAGELKERAAKQSDTQKAISFLFHETAQRMCKNLQDEAVQQEVIQSLDIESETLKIRDKLKNHFENLGISHTAPEVFFVGEFPAPFESSPHVAMAFNGEEYGIASGVYFKKSSIRPVLTPLTMCHEYVHVILSRLDDGLMGSALEEGIAVLYGEIYLFGELYGYDLAKTAFVFNRHSTHFNKNLDSYLDSMRLALPLVLAGGEKALEDILTKGRREVLLQAQGLHQDKVPTVHDVTNSAFVNMATYAATAIGKTSFTTPEACWTARFVKTGMTCEEVAAKSGLSIKATQGALQELSSTPKLLNLKKGRVINSICEHFHQPLQLRCQLPDL